MGRSLAEPEKEDSPESTREEQVQRTPHTYKVSLAPLGQAGAKRWGQSQGSSFTARVSLSFIAAW